MKPFATILIALLFALPAAAAPSPATGPSLDDRVAALEPALDSYPPRFKDAAQRAATLKTYTALKRDLDKQVAAQPQAEQLLFLRGRLQALGHNMDVPEAWKGASEDLTAVLKAHPDNVPAILALGALWVNSDLDLAGKAEQLFRQAQCSTTTPIEEAQRGIFFALYYQSKFAEAYAQARYLVATWPNDAGYRRLADTARSVLAKHAAPDSAVPTGTPVMADCHNG